MYLFALSSMASAVVAFFLGTFVFLRNPRSPLNRVFLLFCITLSFWAYAESQARIAETLTRAQTWLMLRSIAPLMVALLLHFVIVFTERDRVFKNRIGYAILYLPAILFVFVEAFILNGTPMRTVWGWSEPLYNSPWFFAHTAWALLLQGTSLGLCMYYYRRGTSPQIRKMAKHVLIGISFPVIIGSVTEFILPVMSIRFVELTTASAMILGVSVAYAIGKYDLFALTPSTAAQSIISTMADALFLVDADHIIQNTNNAALRMLGYAEHELIGHPVNKVLVSVTTGNDTTHATVTQVLKGGVITDIETFFIAKDQRRIAVSLSWSTARSASRKVLGITLIGRDISERIKLRESLEKSRDEMEQRVEERTRELKVSNTMLRDEIAERMGAEERLAAEKEHLAVTLRSIGDGVITTDRDNIVTLSNNAAEELCGRLQQEMVGQRIDTLFTLLDDQTRAAVADPVRFLTSFTPADSAGHRTAILQLGNGTQRVVAFSGAPFYDRIGNRRGMVLVLRDISDRRRREEETFKTQKLESIALLAGGIAHDFNNLLTGIMTSLFVARMHVQAGTEVHELLSDAENAAFKATTLTKQLMSFSKDSAPQRELTSIRSLIEESVGFCLSGSKVDYQLQLPDNLYMVDADRGLIDQALNHIIMNAEQAMSGGGTISITAENMVLTHPQVLPLQAGEHIRISISDQGPGIPREILTKIFDPYFSTKSDRAGLGLTTAYSIMRKHGGCIDVESSEGGGTTFHIYLPAAQQNHTSSDTAQKPSAPAKSGRRNILIMDDEELIRISTSRLLSHLGYNVTATANGESAIEQFTTAAQEERSFDAVILDLTVPGGMGGKETLERLLVIDPEVKALVTSGYASDPAMTDFRSAGFKGALNKPFTVDELSAKLKQIVS